MYYCGIDNGVTGSIGLVDDEGNAKFYEMPTFKSLNYTKQKRFFTRINVVILERVLEAYHIKFCLLERPMIHPGRFLATMSALRALEATLICLERIEMPYSFIDSKEWQKELLPKGLKGTELKFAGIEVCKRLFPNLELTKGCDADGVLIAEYCRRIKR